MGSTYAILKHKTANRVGKTDNATANTIRDNCIVDAVTQICTDNRFSWTLAKDTLSVVAGAANLPTDYNPSFGLVFAVHQVTGTANDREYTRVDIRDIDNYSSSDYVYYITYDTSSGVYVFNSNQTTDTVVIYYHFLPTELSSDSDVSIVPDDMAVVYLAVALWWLAKERDESNYDRFYKEYEKRLAKMVLQDAAYNTTRTQLKSKLGENTGESILATQR